MRLRRPFRWGNAENIVRKSDVCVASNFIVLWIAVPV